MKELERAFDEAEALGESVQLYADVLKRELVR